MCYKNPSVLLVRVNVHTFKFFMLIPSYYLMILIDFD